MEESVNTKPIMITVERENTLITSGIKDTVSFGIKQDGLAHIFSVLRNQLYSDKILAVIREYCCNSLDAHTDAGKPNEPIVVTLPTRWETTFKVRDFGSGLSDADIHDIYAFYGESTKRKSNKLIGQLGLGSKSAFAYGDNFVIVSYVDGVKNIYNAFIDVSQVGQIAKLGSKPTTEPNGVEIQIAVKEHDVQAFHDKAYNLFRYFKVRPVVHGATFDYEAKTPLLSGADWRVYGDSSSPVAIMGNIGYPIDNHWYDDTITAALKSGLQIDFNIGDLEIAASREKLQYSDLTKKAIHDKLTRVVKEVSTELNSKFISCPTLFDAHKLYHTVMDLGSNLYPLRGMVKSILQFNGKRISSSDLDFNPSPDESFTLKHCETTWRNSSKIRLFPVHKVPCRAETVLIDNDLMIQGGIVNRVYNLVTVDGKNVFVLNYRDAAAKQAFLTESGLEDSNFIKLSSLPKISLAAVPGAVVKNVKHASKEFSFDVNYSGSSSNCKYSDYWLQETVDVANDAGVYLIIDGFKYQAKQGYYNEPCDLMEIIKSLTAFGITIPKIYGFKVKSQDIVKNNPNMVSFWDFLQTELTAYFLNNNIAQKLADRMEYDNYCRNNWQKFMETYGTKVSNKTVFFKVTKVFSYMKHEVDKKILDEAIGYKKYFTPTDKPKYELGPQVELVNKTYPLLKYIRYWDEEKEQNMATVKYIDLIDG